MSVTDVSVPGGAGFLSREMKLTANGNFVNENDNDNDHSFSQLRVHKTLTCPTGQSAWAVGPSPVGQGNSLNAKQ